MDHNALRLVVMHAMQLWAHDNQHLFNAPQVDAMVLLLITTFGGENDLTKEKVIKMVGEMMTVLYQGA